MRSILLCAAGRQMFVVAIVVLTTLISATIVPAQEPPAAQRAFEAGRYQEAVDVAAAGADPAALFVGALSAQKLNAGDRATTFLDQLAARPAADAWHSVGLAAKQLLAGDDAAALESARRAEAADPALSEASYTLGLVLIKRQDWRGAADAFDRASMKNPSFAHAYYYAGVSHNRASRPDLMAARFERFLKLAPDAPERTEVQQIMRTIRGR